MSASEFKAALTELELTQEAAAAFLQIGLRTCAGYANDRKIPRAVQLLLELMVRQKIKPESLA
jgi:hypothetical protein